MKWPGVLLIFVALIIGAEPSDAKESSHNLRIIGGTPAERAAYPWMVALIGSQGASPQTQFCGGSLIAQRWVLTAAHCVEESRAQDVDAYIGIHDLGNPSGQRISIKRIIIHPTYASRFSDIALLELTQDASAQPVRLADPALMNRLGVGSMMTVAGWGNRSTGDDVDTPLVLHHVDVPLVDHGICRTAFAREQNEITNEMLCAGYVEGRRDSCNGDSGGPLVARIDGVWTQTGIVSFGSAAGCAAPGFYGVYASVPAFFPWIAENTSTVTMTEALAFGPVIPGQTVSQAVTVTNHSTGSVTLSAFRLAGTDASDFALGANGCDATTLAPAGQCTVTVNLNGTGAGNRAAELTATATLGTSTSTLTARLRGKVLARASFATALDNAELTFYTGGDAAWTTEAAVSVSGGTALRAGSIGDNQESIVLATVTGPGTLTFAWRTSSERGDAVEVYVDANRVDSLSGDATDWTERSVEIAAGSHRVYWRYAKNAALSAGADTGYLDNVRFRAVSASTGGSTGGNTAGTTPTATTTPAPLASQASGGGGGGGATGVSLLLLLGLAGTRRRKS